MDGHTRTLQQFQHATAPRQKMSSKKQTIDEVVSQFEWVQEALAKCVAELSQTRRVLWLAVQAAGGKVTLDESKIPPLWKLEKFREGPLLVLESQTMPFPPPEKLDALVKRLQGTKLEISSLQKELQLEEWPANWLTIYISDRLVHIGDRWMPAEVAKADHQKSENN